MDTLSAYRRRHPATGNSLVELALVLSVLLVLVLGVIDYGRAIQFNNILVNMSREGGNIAARTQLDPGYIITALSTTAAPMEMSPNGMIYITTVQGTADGVGTVKEQYRLDGGNASLASRVYACPSWTRNTCNIPKQEPVVHLPVLRNGELIHVVETAYDFTPIVGFVMKAAPQLYSQTTL